MEIPSRAKYEGNYDFIISETGKGIFWLILGKVSIKEISDIMLKRVPVNKKDILDKFRD